MPTYEPSSQDLKDVFPMTKEELEDKRSEDERNLARLVASGMVSKKTMVEMITHAPAMGTIAAGADGQVLAYDGSGWRSMSPPPVAPATSGSAVSETQTLRDTLKWQQGLLDALASENSRLVAIIEALTNRK
jgi:hypothetical protein